MIWLAPIQSTPNTCAGCPFQVIAFSESTEQEKEITLTQQLDVLF